MNILEDLINDDVNFEAAMEAADHVPVATGLDLLLIQKEDIPKLVGVPFMVVGGTFREKLDPRTKKKTDFLTVAAIVASQSILDKKRIKMEDKPFGALDLIGFNDGSTGVRRQIVKYLHERGIIQVTNDEIVEAGPKGESSYDRMVGEWIHHEGGELSSRENGDEVFWTWNFELPKGFMAGRGLRISTYGGKNNDDNATKYLA